uniref:Kinesin-like protein n=1 Tax=uncultured bacterium lac160 TaxID=1447241 RepID=X2LJQ9_9BACT|nr:kinesin-like protein [uncultured bacterium lac160]
MVVRLQAVFHQVRLDLRRSWLHRRERAALCRLGEVLATTGPIDTPDMRRWKQEIDAGLGRIESLTRESRCSLEADRADLAIVARWMAPVVMLRGICTRLVLRHAKAAARRELRPSCEALGELAASRSDAAAPVSRQVAGVRAELARVLAERERWVAPYGGSAIPAGAVRAGVEASGFGRAVAGQLRSHLLPKAPALVGLAVGWWIANTYTDSHLRSALRSIGIGSGGTRVVSSSTYEAMSFWLPLLAAALCAYAGERIGGFYGLVRHSREAAMTGDPEAIDRSA